MLTKFVRKLQFTGNSTYVISLPKEWVLKHGLFPGSQMLIKMSGSSLLITPYKQEGGEEKSALIVIKEGESHEAILRKIVGAYVMGYDEIAIKSEKEIPPRLRNKIREFVVIKLLGAEIVNEDVDKIRIRVLLKAKKGALWDSVRRLGKVVYSILHDACRVAECADSQALSEIVKEDDMVDRAYFYSMRVINMMAGGELELDVRHVDLLILRAAIKLLERIGDHATYLALYFRPFIAHGDVSKEIASLCRTSLEIFSTALNGFLNNDPLIIEEIAPRVKTLKEVEDVFLSEAAAKLKPQDFAALRMAIESIRRISEYSRDLGELSLDMNIEKVIMSMKQRVE